LIESSASVITSGTTVDTSGTNSGGTTTISSSTVVLSTSVTAVNDAPSAADATVNSHQEEVYVFVDSNFGFADPIDNNNRLSVIITKLTDKGTLKYNGQAIALQAGVYEVTYDDIMAKKLTFVPTPNAPIPDPQPYTSFTFKNRDDGGTANGGVDTSAEKTISINLLDRRGPIQTVPAEQTIDEDTTVVFSTSSTPSNAISVKFYGDGTSPNLAASLTMTLSVTAGKLTVGSSPNGLSITGNDSSTLILTGTQGLINQALEGLTYTPVPNQNSLLPGGGHTYTILTVSTRNNPATGENQYETDTDQVDIAVRPVNDAPVATGSASLTAVDEDSTDPAGATVATLFGSNFSDAADQVTGGSSANTLVGIAITGYTRESTKGEWQYRDNANSGTWTTISNSINGDSSSKTFKSTDSLRFLPAANFNGSAPTLTVRLIESSTPSPVVTNAVVNVSSNGGSTSISAATVVLSTSVTAVNDAPIASGASTLASISEDSTNPAGDTVSNLFSARFNDSADQVTGGTSANSLAGIAITNYTRASSKGEWQYSTDGGTNWTSISASISPTELGDTATLTIASSHRLRFLPRTDFNGPAPSLSVRLLETPMSVTTGATVNVSINGGSTSISSAKVVLSHSVTAMNDAPVASGSATLAAINEDNTTPAGATVSSLFAGNFSDAKDQVVGGSSSNNFLGVAVQVHTQDASRGYWEYTSDATWPVNPPKLATVTGDNAILLRSTDRIRFVPTLNYNGPATPLVVRLLDNSNTTTNAKTAGAIVDTSTNNGTTEISSALVTLTHTVNPVNDPPVSTNNTITIDEDQVRPLTTADFGNYSDVENQPFSTIKIVTRPDKGTLQYNVGGVWTPITTNGGDYAISDATIKFRYIPAQNENGNNYTTIVYQVSDGVDFSVSNYTVTINVTPVNDPPISTGDAITSDEDALYYFNLSDFGTYSDVEGDSLAAVQITSLPSLGTLEYNNGSGWVSALGAQIAPSLLTGNSGTSKLRYMPPANAFGSPFTQFEFKVSDGADYSLASYTVTINIAPVNDAPEATGSALLTSVFKNDTDPAWATVSSLFSSNFSDLRDTGDTQDSFYGVAIQGLTQDVAKGRWEYKIGSTVGDVPNSTDASSFVLLGADSLRFVPASNYTGNATSLSVRLIETKSSAEATATGPSDASGSTANVSSNGGTTVYSSGTVSLIHEVKGTLLVKAFNDVSEGSNAIFCISLDSNTSVSGTNVTLGLTPGSASSSSDFGPTYAEAYYYDGSNNKQTLTISGNLVTLPQNVTVFFVSVPTTDDSPKVYEGPETFSLSASITVEGTPISNSDAATIRDDGNGIVFNPNGTANNSATPDNDLSVSVNGYGPVNEGSTYAMFKVDASSGDALNLSVINGTATLVTPMIEFSLDGTTWTLFNASATGGFPTVPAGAGNLGTVYVRVTITSESDSMYEGSESFSLKATSRANSSTSDTESTSIVDDGSGLKYTGDFTSGSPNTDATNLDNDLSVSVTSYSPVNEGSTWAMFKVVGAAGDTLSLNVTDIETTLSPSSSPNVPPMWYSTNGTSWTLYSSSNKPTVPGTSGTGTVYVRVNITDEQETALDTSERFTLIATSNGQGNKSGSADTMILDNGSGVVFDGNFGNDLPVLSNNYRDDDRLLAVANTVYNSIPAAVTFSDVRVNDTNRAGLTISELIGLNPTASTVSSTVTTPQGTWAVLTGGRVQFVPVAGLKTDPTPLDYAISPDGGVNYSRNTAKLYVDYGAVTQADSVDNVALNAGSVTLDVLANDTLGDTIDTSYLKILNPTTGLLVEELIVTNQGTWSVIVDGGVSKLRFVPLRGTDGMKSFPGDPTPVRYVGRDVQVSNSDGVRGGNQTVATLASIRYRQNEVQPTFFIRIDDWINTATRGWNVIVVDNLDAGQAVTIQIGTDAQGAAITLPMTTTHKDMDNSVGIIYYEGALPSYSVVKVDARSKPVTTGSVADIRISSTTQSTRAASIEIQAADQGFVSAGSVATPVTTNRLSSPLSGNQAGTSVVFRETLGLSNQGLPGATESTAAVGSRINNNRTITTRTISSGFQSSAFTTTGQSVSLMKSLITTNTGVSQITSLTAGGKIINDEMSLRERLASLEWVMSPGLYGVGVDRAGAQFHLVPMTLPATQSLTGSQRLEAGGFEVTKDVVLSNEFQAPVTNQAEQTAIFSDLEETEKIRASKIIRLNKNGGRSLIDSTEVDSLDFDL
jgi:hypothetical protein